jgi:hypothetical protein
MKAETTVEITPDGKAIVTQTPVDLPPTPIKVVRTSPPVDSYRFPVGLTPSLLLLGQLRPFPPLSRLPVP